MDRWLKYFTKEEVAGFKNARNLYGKAYLICEKVFDGKSHSSGVPYMDHLVAVADRFSDDKAKVVALLHDIMKETELTAMDLNYIGFPSDIVKTVSLMTRENGESYDEFINRMINSKNNMAVQIKKADLEQNMDLSNYESVTDEYLNRIDVKYKPQYEKIVGYLGDLEKEN
ncbi:putative uncharacterized protein [Firmicutes bacterium CAG:822]|nr:putative uncharacterized protein [Firmicutes bacterium CAG:822]